MLVNPSCLPDSGTASPADADFHEPADAVVREAIPAVAAGTATGRTPADPIAEEPPLVLVVEDDGLIAMGLQELLLLFGFRVQGPAATAIKARRLVDQVKPAVALLDANLDGVSSAGLAAELDSLGIPVVFCTGYQSVHGLPDSLARAPVLTKPITPEQLRSTLFKVLCRSA